MNDWIKHLNETVTSMTEEERLDLDPISEALDIYFAKYPPRKGGRVLPNRATALAALNAAKQWEKEVFEDE